MTLTSTFLFATHVKLCMCLAITAAGSLCHSKLLGLL
jgi:hypothetical protein